MKNQIIYIYLFVVLLYIFAKPAHAYIDPGTGQMIVGGLGPVILGVLSVVGGFLLRYIVKIYRFARGRKKTKNNNTQNA